MSRIELGLRIARQEAAKSKCPFALGACLIKNGKPLARGHNAFRSSKLALKYYGYPTVHAELAALQRLSPEEARGGTLFVYRLSPTGPAMAKPCETCEDVLRFYGIRKVIYSTRQAPHYSVWNIDYSH